VKDAQVNQRSAATRIADLRARLRGLDVAVDKAGNRLAEAIAAYREQWLVLLGARPALSPAATIVAKPSRGRSRRSGLMNNHAP
jgi:hypothetical protein